MFFRAEGAEPRVTNSSDKYEAWKTLPPLPDDHPLANNHTLLVAGANDQAKARKDGS